MSGFRLLDPIQRSYALDQLVLGTLLRVGRVTATELAERLAARRRPVLASLERLQKRRLVERIPAPHPPNRRECRERPTAHAHG